MSTAWPGIDIEQHAVLPKQAQPSLSHRVRAQGPHLSRFRQRIRRQSLASLLEDRAPHLPSEIPEILDHGFPQRDGPWHIDVTL